MHKHFRMIAISEHLRNHGFDPDVFQHLRIPHIWDKLRTYYDLDLIDEREYYDDDDPDDKYVDFSLPHSDFLRPMMQRAAADSSEAPTSPPEMALSPEATHSRKRKRSGTLPKARAPSAEDTEDGGMDAPSPPAARTTTTKRGGGGGGLRGRRRAASHSARPERAADKAAEKAETTEEEEEEEDEEEDAEEESGSESGEEEEEGGSADEGGTPASRPTRAASRKRAAPKPTRRTTRLRR